MSEYRSLNDLINQACERFEDNQGNSSDQMEVMIEFICDAYDLGQELAGTDE